MTLYFLTQGDIRTVVSKRSCFKLVNKICRIGIFGTWKLSEFFGSLDFFRRNSEIHKPLRKPLRKSAMSSMAQEKKYERDLEQVHNKLFFFLLHIN